MDDYTKQDEAYRAYQKGLEAGRPKWIPVSERLPEKLKEVITYRGECGTSIEYTYGDGAWFFDDEMVDDVTHWMPLPTPPKGESA